MIAVRHSNEGLGALTVDIDKEIRVLIRPEHLLTLLSVRLKDGLEAILGDIFVVDLACWIHISLGARIIQSAIQRIVL